jgi:hypothetical protein
MSGWHEIWNINLEPTHVDAVVKKICHLIQKKVYIWYSFRKYRNFIGNPKDPFWKELNNLYFSILGLVWTFASNKKITFIVDNILLYWETYSAFSDHKSRGLTNFYLRFGFLEYVHYLESNISMELISNPCQRLMGCSEKLIAWR